MPRKLAVVSLATLAVVSLLAACSTTSKPGLARGRQLYDTCLPCHGARGEGSATLAAPAIAGLPAWYLEEQLVKFRGGVRGAHPDDVEGHRMRPMARTLYRDGDLESVVEYVAALPPVTMPATLAGGDAGAGATQYAALCIACHGGSGEGSEALHAPAITRQSDWYMLAQLRKFKSGMRGAHPDDIYGSQMRAMSMVLEDEQAMRNVIAYVKTLGP